MVSVLVRVPCFFIVCVDFFSGVIVEMMYFLAYVAWYSIWTCVSVVLGGFKTHITGIVFVAFVFFKRLSVFVYFAVSFIVSSHYAESH